MPYNLAALRVLVTRPDPKGQELCELIAAASGEAVHLPTLAFDSYCDHADFLAAFKKLDQQDWIIFISPQAVFSTLKLLQLHFPNFPLTTKLAAIGAGTAQALRAANYACSIIPHSTWNSEGLLAATEFQSITHKKIAIIRGKDGREILDSELEKRGAQVLTLIAYERIIAQVSEQTFINLENKPIDITICTSQQGLINLQTLALSRGKNLWETLTDKPMMVMSERIKKLAQHLGFQTIWVVPPSSHHSSYNETLVAALAKYKDHGMTNDTLPTENKENVEPPIIQPAPSSSKFSRKLFSILTIVLIMGSLAVGMLALLQVNYSIEQMVSALQIQVNYQQRVIHILQKSIDTLHDSEKKSEEIYKQQEQVMDEWRSAQKGDLDKWRLAEGQHLVKMANDYLQFSNNISMALKLLQNADQILEKITNLNVFDLRKSLAAEINRLNAIPDIDVTGLYLQLNLLNQDIDQLPLPITPFQENPPSAQGANSAYVNLPWWKVIYHRAWDAIQKVVIVHYNGSNELPLILPKEKSFLIQNLHSQIENAMWGLLHRQGEVYKSSLKRAQTWVQQYFLQDTPATKAFLEKLSALQNIDIVPATTNVTETLDQFNVYFKPSAEPAADVKPTT